ncbi:hypothetical protein [Aquabacterium sp. J223]|uniref:hypothetical protein n=1 Tax=Aquabacterium sp. J223 TaxID=2898431 RepID=UPI0021AE2963|nr:hypothetical protein [Aquabacterium sp. J223]UUX96841.1 hypothetical protein LRS07_06070 [Aquabacterium sp. J223]
MLPLAARARLPQAGTTLVMFGLLCNPIALCNAATFMTDTPFMAVAMLAMALVVAAWERPRYRWLAWAAIAWACSIRQGGIALAAAWAVSDLVRGGLSRRWWWAMAAPTVALLLALVLYPRALAASVGLPSMFHIPTDMLKQSLVELATLKPVAFHFVAKQTATAVFYTGLGALPVLWWRSAAEPRHGRRLLLCLGLSLGLTALLWTRGLRMPLTLNTVVDAGLGVRTLPGAEGLPAGPAALWFGLTWLGCFAVALLAALLPSIGRACRALRRSTDEVAAMRLGLAVLALVTLVVYNLPFVLVKTPWFDRYSVFSAVLLGLVALAASTPGTSPPRDPAGAPRSVVPALLLALGLAIGVAGTHDYLSWHRATWAANRLAVERWKLGPDQLDGGFEYNNFTARVGGDVRRPADAVDLKKPQATHRVAFAPLPGTEVVERVAVDAWLPTSPQAIYLLRLAR